MADQFDPASDEIPFTPVPSHTNRRDGWTEARQRGFIAALSRCGSVTAAARQVGKSARSAYALRERPGADSFAEAWDMAAEMGRDATLDCVIDRAMNGAWVPVVRRGRIVRMEFRHFDRLAIAVLSGCSAEAEERRAEAKRSRDERRAQRSEERRLEALRQAHEEAIAEAARRAGQRREPPPRAEPRIILL